MASLFDVSLRPSEPADQEISEALLGTWKIRRRVHGPQKVVLRDLSIEGGDQACETFRANHRINFEFLHFLSSPYRNVPLIVLHEGVEHARRIFDVGVGPLQIAVILWGAPGGPPFFPSRIPPRRRATNCYISRIPYENNLPRPSFLPSASSSPPPLPQTKPKPTDSVVKQRVDVSPLSY